MYKQPSMGLMIQGTASDVGKSFLAAAICRLLVNEGYKVAPFKSQNMTDNVAMLEDGREIGLSQSIQAKASKIKANVNMNPVLLKPNDGRVEIILSGERVDTSSGSSYKEKFYDTGLQAIKTALAELANNYDVIVMEGAGSPVELNLKERELVNMPIAELADVPVIVVADIERGGVFANVVGTMTLLSKKERTRVKGIIINKFRGDAHLFADGVRILEEKAGIPVIGVIPYIEPKADLENGLEHQAAHVKENLDWEQLKSIIFQWRSS